MTDFDELDTYNGDTEHDMWVEYDNIENTGTPDVFDEPYIGNVMDTLNYRD